MHVIRKGYSRKAVNQVVFAKYPDLEPEKAACRLKLAFRVGPEFLFSFIAVPSRNTAIHPTCFSPV